MSSVGTAKKFWHCLQVCTTLINKKILFWNIMQQYFSFPLFSQHYPTHILDWNSGEVYKHLLRQCRNKNEPKLKKLIKFVKKARKSTSLKLFFDDSIKVISIDCEHIHVI